jgi:VanZ family protein
VLAVVVTALGVYWSVKPESTMPLAEYFPAWLPAWAERHGEFRNYPAYFIVSVLWFIAGRTWRQRLVAGFALAVFGGLAEVIQIGLPYRYASPVDAAWSWAGIATAWALCRLGRRAIRRWRENRMAGTFVDQRETKAQRESI